MSVSQNINPMANKTQMLCSEPRLARLSEGRRRRAGCCSSHSLTRLEASPADSLTDRLEEGLVEALDVSQQAVSQSEKDGLAEDWCVTLSGGTLRKVSRLPIWRRLSKWKSVYKSHTARRRSREAGWHWCKARRKRKAHSTLSSGTGLTARGTFSTGFFKHWK